MKPNEKWPAEQFLAYILLFAAHADVQYKRSEKTYILSKVGERAYKEAFEAFSKDNSYVQLKKILLHHIEQNDYPPELLINEILLICLCDNQFHPMEKYMISRVRGLLNNTTV